MLDNLEEIELDALLNKIKEIKTFVLAIQLNLL